MGSFCVDGQRPANFVGIMVVRTDYRVIQQFIEGIDRYNAIASVVKHPSKRKTLADLSVLSEFH